MVTKPTTIDGAASTRKSHCQPRRPPTEDILSRSQPETGPPMTPESGIAVMNAATILARCLLVYQNVR